LSQAKKALFTWAYEYSADIATVVFGISFHGPAGVPKRSRLCRAVNNKSARCAS